jgi:hypothetical protein
MHDTTGKLVITFADSGTRTIVARDRGWYEGTKPEYNMRKIETLRTLELTITSPPVRALVSRVPGYGCSWGDTSMLYPVAEADVAALVTHEAEVLAARRKVRDAEDALMAVPVRHGVGWCNKCESYCFGDCEASDG